MQFVFHLSHKEEEALLFCPRFAFKLNFVDFYIELICFVFPLKKSCVILCSQNTRVSPFRVSDSAVLKCEVDVGQAR